MASLAFYLDNIKVPSFFKVLKITKIRLKCANVLEVLKEYVQ